MANPLQAAKQQLRLLMKQKLSTFLSTSSRLTAIGRRVFEALQSLRPYQDAMRISIYLSMPEAEIQTDAIVRHALDAGKQVFVPYLHKSYLDMPGTPARVMDMVHLKSIQDYESLQRDRWGIPSVDPSSVHQRQRILGGPDAQHSDQSVLDLILLPGVAFKFNQEGEVSRLGHGKGFYDFFLNRYLTKSTAHSSHPLQLWGLALDEQLLPSSSESEIPVGPLDRPLDGLVLGSGEIKAANKRAFNEQYQGEKI